MTKQIDIIMDRLRELNLDLEVGEYINFFSLHYFIFCMCENDRIIKVPMISLTSDNEIYCCWKKNDDNLLSIIFREDKKLKYVVFKKVSRKVTNRFEKECNLSEFIDIIEQNNLYWVKK